MYPGILEVEAGEDYSLFIVFENGEKGFLDMRPYLKFGAFRRIQNIERFKRVKVALDTIEWDENLDLDPEFIYEKSIPFSDCAVE
jgi:hypothetical protein